MWILAHLGGPAAIDELVELARSDPDPRVQAQAVRAVADLADPVLTRHRLAGGPGDAELAARLAALADGRDPRVRPGSRRSRSAACAGRELRPGSQTCSDSPTPPWSTRPCRPCDDRRTGRPCWRCSTGRTPGRRDPGAAGARRPRRACGRRRPDRPPGGRNASGPSSPVRRSADARLQEARPVDLLGIPPGPAPGEHSRLGTDRGDRRGARSGAGDPDAAVRLAVLRRMLREKVATRLSDPPSPAEGQARAGCQWPPSSSRCGDHPADERRDLLAEVVADRSQEPANRLAALALWPVGDEGVGQKKLVELAGELEDGPVLAAALRRVTKRSLPSSGSLLTGKLSLNGRGCACGGRRGRGAHRPIGCGRTGSAACLRIAIRSVRRAAAEAAGELGLKGAGDPLLELVRDPDPGVRAPAWMPCGSCTSPGPYRWPSARSPIAKSGSPPWSVSPTLGGPAQADVVSDLAKRSPTAEILPLAVRILTDWGQQRGLSDAERLALDRAVAEVQGATELLVRWQVTGPIPPESVAALVARAGRPGRPFEPPARRLLRVADAVRHGHRGAPPGPGRRRGGAGLCVPGCVGLPPARTVDRGAAGVQQRHAPDLGRRHARSPAVGDPAVPAGFRSRVEVTSAGASTA